MKVPWSPPDIGLEERKEAKRVIDSGWLTQGKETDLFENELAQYIGCKHAVIVNNGTSALIAALMAHGIGPGDEVIVPTFTFIATVNSILAVGATPVLVDCDIDTFNTKPELVEQKFTKKTKAIMPVDVAGMPIDIEGFESLVEKKGVILIEDAAEAIGAEYKNRKIGSFGHLAILSFHMAKVAAAVEGGAILTNDDAIAEKCHMIKNHGMKKKFQHEEFGLNFRITDIQSAIGRVQLRKVEDYIIKRNNLVDMYKDELKGLVEFQKEPSYVTRHPYMIFNILVSASKQKEVIEELNKNNIGNRISWVPVHKQIYHKNLFKEEYPNSEKIASRIISLPLGNALEEEQVHYVCKIIKQVLR